MARVAGRAQPLMETLGGCAIAIAITYGGYRVIETGGDRRAIFLPFIAAFLLAYEPATRGLAVSTSNSTARWWACASCSKGDRLTAERAKRHRRSRP